MRFTTLFGFSAAVVCAAFLVACGGGGHSGGPGGVVPGGTQQVANSGPGTRVTVIINRTPHTAHTRSTSRRGARASRRPQYVPSNANGLQITVSATGIASQSVYADVSQSSPLCTTTNHIATCVITVPTLAASEQFVALETDSLPTNDTAGYGTGFGAGSNIVGAITQSETVQLGGANAIGLEVGPVTGHFFDCSDSANLPSPMPQTFSQNYGIDSTPANSAGFTIGSRIVVTAGVAATGMIAPEFCNPGPNGPGFNNYNDYDTTPAPFVDVNGSPTPITLTSNTSSLTLAPIVNSGTPPPTSAYAQTASIANDGFEWFDCNFFVGVKTTASFAAPATIVINNNLTALNAFLSPPSSYASTMTYSVVPISVSSTSVTVAASGTTTVTATDSNASDPMSATSSYANEAFPGDDNCNTSGGVTLATITDGTLNTTNWTQLFTINAGATTGTCTFYVYDTDADTLTLPITVTIN